jgi:AraC family transcriptional regulator
LLSSESPQLVTPFGTAELSAIRLLSDGTDGGIHISAPGEDAFCILFQRLTHPAHDFWREGKLLRADASPRGTISVVDLSIEPAARLTEPVDTLMFHMPRATLDLIAEEAGAHKIAGLSAWGSPDPVVQQLQELVTMALEQPHAANRLLYDHLLLALGAHFATTYGDMRPRIVAKRGGLAPWQETRAKELIAGDLAKVSSLPEIARECGLSAAHFARAFKVSTGMTPHAFLQMCRVETAKDILLRPQMPLAAVALACGFADQSHFTRVFTRRMGLGPGAWRRLRCGAAAL